MGGFGNNNNRRLDEKFKEALQFHQKNDLVRARNAYEHVLRLERNHPDAHYFLALLLRDGGDPSAALGHFERAAALQPGREDFQLAYADACIAAGMDEKAHARYAEVVRKNPGNAVACFRLGQAEDRAGRLDAAVDAYKLALSAQPGLPEALNNLGNTYRKLGNIDAAERAYREALASRPGFAEAYRNLGVLSYFDRQRYDEAVECYRKAIELKPGFVDAYFGLAIVSACLGRKQEAVEAYEQVLALKPDHAEAYNNLGMIFFEEGFNDEARACYERALDIQELAEAHNNLGLWWSREENTIKAAEHYREALRIRPEFADAYNGLGRNQSVEGNFTEAIESLRRAIMINPAFPEALANLGKAYHESGQMAEAVEAYLQADAIQPCGALRLRAASALPPIMGDRAAILESRKQLDNAIDRIMQAPVLTPESDFLKYGDTSFYLAYHGLNDRDLQTRLAQAHLAMCPELEVAADVVPAEGSRRIRVGFISKFFFNHSVGNSFRRLISHLCRNEAFEIVMIGLGNKIDDAFLGDAASSVRQLRCSVRALQPVREAIAQEQLDILIYTDIGMDPFTYCLAFSRLARIQCVMAGHPVTTGIPTIDHFFSWTCYEPDDGEAHYSENLYRLVHGGTSFQRLPPLALKGREALGMPTDRRLYVCPHKLQKLHPDFDTAILRILQDDDRAEILLFDDMIHQSWRPMLEQRLKNSLPSSLLGRIRFLPWARTIAEFMSINKAADAILDCFHFGAGTTAVSAIDMGLPIVTLPGEFARGRGVYGMYAYLDVADPVAASVDDFVSKAIAMARQPDMRDALGRTLAERSGILFDNTLALLEMESVLMELARR